MPDKIVAVPGTGNVSFPDTMSDDDIGKAISAQQKPTAPPSMIDNLESMAGKATSYIKNLASKPIPDVSDADRQQFPQTSAAYQKISDFAGKPLLPQSVSNYVSDVSRHASTITGNPTATGILTGVDQGAGKVVKNMTTPANLGMLGAMAIPGVGEAAALGFGLQGGAQAVKEGVAAKTAYDQGDIEGAAEHATGGLANAVFAGLGLKGMIHGEVPPTDTQSPVSPVADHPNTGRTESVAANAGDSNPQNLPTQNGASTTPPNAAGAFDILGRPTEDDAYKLGTKGDQGVRVKPLAGLLPASVFEAKGDNLPAQTGTASPMSPEAEAVSKSAQDQAEGQPTQNVSPQAPSVLSTEGLNGSDDTRVKALEDSIRTQTGQVMRLNQLADGNKVHAALERGIDETQRASDPRAQNVGPGLEPDDQKLLSIAMGEKVGAFLTDDQVNKAYALRGKFMSDEPELQNRPNASRDRLAKSRAEMSTAMATTEDPELKAKLADALQPGEDGKLKPILYEPARKNAEDVALDPSHPEAPFAPKTFGATYPEISMKTLETATGEKQRSVDMGLGDPELKKQLQAAKTGPTASGAGTVREGSDGFGYDTPRNPKGITGDAKRLQNEIKEGAVRAKAGQISSQLRDDVKSYQSLRDPSKSSPLIDQLNKLSPDTLPKDVRELVKPSKSEASPKDASAEVRTRTAPAEKRNTPASSTGTTLGKAKTGVVNLFSDFKDNHPEHLGDVKDIIQTAADHFGNDTNGAVVASYHALRVFKQGVEADDPYAMRSAIKEIRRLTPAPDSGVGLDTSTKTTFAKRNGATLYSGLDPEIAKTIAKDVAKGTSDLKNYLDPKLTPEDLTASSSYHANAVLSRYERMTPIDRGAFRAQIHSDELDRSVAEGDPDGSKGFHDRLEALRQVTKPDDFYSRMKEFIQKNEKGILADDTSRMIRSANGDRYVNDLRLETGINKFSTMVNQWSNQESRDFIHKMELGQDQGDSVRNDIASVLRKSLDEARDRITAVNGNFQEYIENYMPHIWANVGKGQELGKQLRGMSGNESFLKNRELATFNEGISQGLQPVTYNPLKLTMMRVEQMNRYAMKEQLKQDFISSNKATLIEGNQPVPDGWVPLEDRAFEKGGSGKYYAPEEVAKVFNNFTSKGFSGKAVIPILNLSAYDGLRSLNNTLNQFQLGLSGLHGAFTLTNSVISELSRGMVKAVNGDVTGGLKTAVSSLNIPERYTLGKNLIAHIKDPNSFQEMNSLADAFQRAGGRVGTDKIMGTAYADQFLKARADAMDDAIKGSKKAAAWGRVASNAIGATLEKFSAPIMEKLVPRMKIGAFAKMANQILADNGDKPAAEIDMKLQQAWDNVDDRFGQMVYDNLFWSKTAKDIAMLTTRAPGWNIGTYRGLGGGLLDLGKSVRDAATKKQRFQITDRTAYLGAVVASTMAVNAMLQTAMTGNGPQQMVDYFYPKTGTQDDNGEENRLMPKMYTYDYINAVKDPVGTVLHKVSPLIGTITQLHANKSFYGRQIYDPGSSVGGRMAQMAAYAMKQYAPLSISNYQEQSTRGNGGFNSFARSFVGILPAPKSADRSAAENLAGEYHAESMAEGGQPGDLFDKHQKFVQLQADLKNGKVSNEELGNRVNSGEIPVSFLDHIYDKQNVPNLERWTKGLQSPQQVMNVFDRATPEEKQRLIPIMIEKMDKLDPSEIPAFANKINAAQFHPDTHVFSVSQWKAAHPGENEQAAAKQAQDSGYEVHQ